MNGLRAEPGNSDVGGIRDAGICGIHQPPRVALALPRLTEASMANVRSGLSPLIWCLLVILSASPAFAQGQTAIAGVVRDATGAVLPGVTVEASSPALIEKVRTAITDSQGQYKIIDLRPGIYSVTFTLAGLQHLSPRRRRADDRLHRQRQRRPAGRLAAGDRDGHRREPDRRYTERRSQMPPPRAR